MKKLLIALFSVLLLTGCVAEPVIVEKEVPIIVEKEIPVYVDKIVEVEVEKEVIPDGYVDVWYYCHEGVVGDIIIDLFKVLERVTNDETFDGYYIYNPDGYDGLPTLEVYHADGTLELEIDILDVMMDYPCFEEYSGGGSDYNAL